MPYNNEVGIPVWKLNFLHFYNFRVAYVHVSNKKKTKTKYNLTHDLRNKRNCSRPIPLKKSHTPKHIFLYSKTFIGNKNDSVYGKTNFSSCG